MNLRVALVGCGNISRSHIAALKSMDGVQIVGVCDRDRFRAEEAAALVGTDDVVITTELDELLAATPDVVHVLTAPDSHAALAIRVLSAGVHAFVEKPMALSAAEADQMLAVAREHGVMVGTCHNYLFKPSVVAARRFVDSGAIGDIVHVNTFYGMAGEGSSAGSGAPGHWAWRLPGGVFTNVLPHLIALQQHFLGEIERTTTAFTHGPRGAPASELTVLVDGPQAAGSMCVSVRARPYAKYVDVFGTNGTLRADLVRELCVLHREHRAPRMVSKALYSLEEAAELTGGTALNMSRVLTGRMGNMPELPATFRAFYDSVESGRSSILSGEHGRRMAVVLEGVAKDVPPAPAVAPPRAGPATSAEREFAARTNAPRVLVTGAAGFLGQHLVAALARCGAHVVAVVRDPGRVPLELEAHADIAPLDLREPERLDEVMHGVDIVFHCAAVTSNNVPWSVQYETNVAGSAAVFDAARRGSVTRVVHVSSVSVYGMHGTGADPVSESDPYGEVDEWSGYARTKQEADALALRRARDEDVPITVLRLGILYGPGERGPLERGLLQVGPVRLTVGRGRNVLPYTYVGNAVDALLLAAVAPDAVGEAYNVVDPIEATVRSVAEQSAAIRGESLTQVPVPSIALTWAARGAEARQRRRGSETPPRLSQYVVRSAVRDLRYDTTKARRELGWEPETPLDEGITHGGRV